MKKIENKSFFMAFQDEQLIVLNDKCIGEISRFCQLVEHGGEVRVHRFSDTAVLLELRKEEKAKLYGDISLLKSVKTIKLEILFSIA